MVKSSSETTSPSASADHPLPKGKEEKGKWKATVDPKTGKTYYWNTKTMKSQWSKPLEMCSPEDRAAIAKEEKERRDFFSDMENNIRRKLKRGEGALDLSQTPSRDAVPPPSAGTTGPELGGKGEDGGVEKRRHRRAGMNFRGRSSSVIDGKVFPTNHRVSSSVSPAPVSYTRRSSTSSTRALTPPHGGAFRSVVEDQLRTTISSLSLSHHRRGVERGGGNPALTHLRGPSDSSGTSTVGVISLGSASELENIFGEGDPDLGGDSVSGEGEEIHEQPSPLRRRNSTSTLYLGENDTMSNPDKDATIMIWASVFRAHLLEAEAIGALLECSEKESEEYSIFDDRYGRRRGGGGGGEQEDPPIPSLEEVSNFFRLVFYRGKLKVDCIILSLCYVERLIQATDGGLAPNARNWRSIIVAVLLLSSKVWDDLALWNADFCERFPMYTLSHINSLERAVLHIMSYDVKVTCGEYAKYYFALRTISTRSGLSDASQRDALDVSKAHYLQEATRKLGEHSRKDAIRLQKCATIGSGQDSKALERLASEGYNVVLRKHKVNVSVEQIVGIPP